MDIYPEPGENPNRRKIRAYYKLIRLYERLAQAEQNIDNPLNRLK